MRRHDDRDRFERLLGELEASLAPERFALEERRLREIARLAEEDDCHDGDFARKQLDVILRVGELSDTVFEQVAATLQEQGSWFVSVPERQEEPNREE